MKVSPIAAAASKQWWANARPREKEKCVGGEGQLNLSPTIPFLTSHDCLSLIAPGH